ncbi:MAG: hypothetical protein WAU47_14300 [Desulfobaccales bacterium]
MEKNRLVMGLVTFAWFAFLALNVHATEDIRKLPVHFKKGASQATIKGHIKGRETIDYVLRAQAGQTMTVNLKTSHPAAYFNVLPPGSNNEAIFTGQVAGPHFEGKLPKDGDYTIRVYLMPSAARRHESAKYTLTIKVAGGAAVSPGAKFDRKLKLLGITFHVTSPNTASGNKLTIVPAGLKAVNKPISRPVDGVVIGAEVADLNADQSPEIYVYVREPGAQARGALVAYSANNKKSLSEIYLPPLSENKDASAGYNGHDEMAVLEGILGRRFPIFGNGGDSSSRTGKTRQLQYKLVAGDAGWVLKLDKTIEY